MDTPERIAQRAECHRRWEAGEHHDTIAAATGINASCLYWWRTRWGWSRRARKHWPSKRTPETVALAAKLWKEGLPRLDICNLLDIGSSALGEWRRRYKWPKRSRGKCGLPGWERVYRRRKHDKIGRARMKALRALRRWRMERPRVQWRCCDQIHTSVMACPDCGRPNPICPGDGK